MYGLKTESSFDAAHFLTDYHGKCENLHGHRWRVVAYLEQAELQTEVRTRTWSSISQSSSVRCVI